MPIAPLIQLVSIGQIDQYLSLTPQLSYFKYVYKRHTRFALDNLKLNFDSTTVPRLGNSENVCIKKIERHGDLLSNLTMVIRLPEINIPSGKDLRFRWVNNYATLLIKKAELFVGSQGIAINTLYGEWMVIWNELTLTPERKYKYDIITENVASSLNPRTSNKQIKITKNNKIEYEYYPVNPAIKSKRIAIPLPFYFSKNPALAIPLCALQTSEVILRIELENVEKLYQVYDKDFDNGLDKPKGAYVSPLYYDKERININNFVKPEHLDLDAHIEAQYVYLNETERKLITVNRRNNVFLVENIYKNTTSTNSLNASIRLDLNTPIKELIWVLKEQNTNNKFNLRTTYTCDNKEILKNAKILWNRSNERVEEKDAVFFNKIQPYIHHSNIPKDGIYCYSFALKPENWQPSGYYNPGGKFPINTSIMLELTEEMSGKTFDIDVYALQYNIFEIIGGMGNFKFS
jgi:hypothetical protein|tara:strand:- start:1690 stop:3072 length:1383 start_codon:yes stop_codon:yes gene_type:complete